MHWTTPWNATFLRMLLANTLCLSGSVMFVMLPAYFEDAGLQRSQIGMADACFWIISVLIQPIVGPNLDRHGRKPYLCLGAFLMAGMAAAYLALPVELGYVLVARTLQGAGFTIYLTSSWTWLADHVSHEKVGSFFGIFGLTSLIGSLIGGGLSQFIAETYGYDAVFKLAAGALGCAFVILVTLSDQPPKIEGAGRVGHLFSLLAARPMRAAALGALGFGLAVGPLFAFAAAYLHGMHLQGVGVLFGLVLLASAFGRIYSGRLMDRWGPASIILPCLMLLGFGCVGLASLAHLHRGVFVVLAISGLSAGLAYGAIYPALNGLALSRLPEEARGRAVSLATASIDLGSTIGALTAGVVSQFFGYPTMFATMGVCVVLAGLLFRWTDQVARI